MHSSRIRTVRYSPDRSAQICIFGEWRRGRLTSCLRTLKTGITTGLPLAEALPSSDADTDDLITDKRTLVYPYLFSIICNYLFLSL